MYICIGENDEQDVKVGRGKTVQDAISDWCGKTPILAYMRDYQKWNPTIIEGEEIQIDFDININIIKP